MRKSTNGNIRKNFFSGSLKEHTLNFTRSRVISDSGNRSDVTSDDVFD